MFGRFFPQSFWNFYDYLGTYLLLGALIFLASAGLAMAAAMLASLAAPVWLRLLLAVLPSAAAFCVLSAGFAGMFEFATAAARDEAARSRHFREGMARLFVPYAKFLLLTLGAAVVLVANIVWYAKMSSAPESPDSPGMAPPLRFALFCAAMLFVWVSAALAVFFPAAAAATARYGPGLRASLKKAFVLFVLSPGFWFAVAVWLAFLAALCAISVAGVVFVIPLLAAFSTTALDTASRNAEFLVKARNELGEGKSVRAYKARAAEIAEEWYAQQPRRTLRELIRPWEQ